jgi:hypothetical protein
VDRLRREELVGEEPTDGEPTDDLAGPDRH